MATTVADAIASAYTRMGVIAAGESPSADDLALAFTTLGELTDAWGAEMLTIVYQLRTTKILTASQTNYTVGTGGDINIVRPQSFNAINYYDNSATIPTEIPLQILTDLQWTRVSQKSLTSSYPSSIYYDTTYAGGLGTLYPIPIPTLSTLYLAMYSPVAIPDFAATSTSLVLPPGARRFIVTNLAKELMPMFRVPVDIATMVTEQAQDAKYQFKQSNYRPADVDFDRGVLQGRGSSSLSDWYAGTI